MPVYVHLTADFALIARRAHRRAVEIRRRVPPLPEQVDTSIPERFAEWQATVRNRIALQEEADRHAYVVIAFSAFCLESYINAFAVQTLSDAYFKDYLDKLDLVAKFMVIPRLSSGHATGSDGELLQRLRTLVRARNRLAHSKTEVVSLENLDKVLGRFRDPQQEADNAIALLDYMAKAVPEFAGVARLDDADDPQQVTPG